MYFDKLLKPKGLWEPNWRLRINSWLRTPENAVAHSTHAQFDAGSAYQFDPGPDRVVYLGITPDLEDVDDLFVLPFGFPITRT